MKKTVVSFFVAYLLSVTTIFSQNAEGIVAGAIAGIAAAAISSEQYAETLENIATNYIIENYSELNTFNLKLMNLNNGVKTLDPSSIRLQLFTIKPFDRNSGIYDVSNFMVLMMITSSGWWNSNGIVYEKVSFEILKKDEWNKILKKYIELSAQIRLEGNDFFLKREKLKQKDEKTNDDLKIYNFSTNKYVYLRKTKDTVRFKYLILGLGSFRYVDITKYGPIEKPALPITNKLDNDSYLIEDHSDVFKIVFNERSLGLYYKPMGELFQIKKSILNEINRILN